MLTIVNDMKDNEEVAGALDRMYDTIWNKYTETSCSNRCHARLLVPYSLGDYSIVFYGPTSDIGKILWRDLGIEVVMTQPKHSVSHVILRTYMEKSKEDLEEDFIVFLLSLT
jgi:hypothetical protein